MDHFGVCASLHIQILRYIYAFFQDECSSLALTPITSSPMKIRQGFPRARKIRVCVFVSLRCMLSFCAASRGYAAVRASGFVVVSRFPKNFPGFFNLFDALEAAFHVVPALAPMLCRY